MVELVMPELPEVETIKLQLQKYLVGHIIENVEIRNTKYEMDTKKILDARVVDIRRFGKAVSIDLSNKYSILIHVKLTGQIIYRGPNLKSDGISSKVTGGLGGKHTHVVFDLDNKGKLYYNDVRKFGWIRILKTEEVEKEKFISALGFDMLLITQEDFNKIMSKTTRAIKVVLMDQSKIGGIGNIYANDALWKSKINPKKPAKNLSNFDLNELYLNLIEVLHEGLKHGGASELAFVTPDGAEGEYQNHSLVYAHTGEFCAHCKTNKIEKYFLGGRGTYWCPSCQA